MILDLIKKDSPPLYHTLKGAKVSLDKETKKIFIEYKGLDFTERQMAILKSKIIEVMGEGFYYEIRKKEEDPAMKTLKPFITKNTNEGFKPQIVKEALIKQGWPKEKIDQAFKELKL